MKTTRILRRAMMRGLTEMLPRTPTFDRLAGLPGFYSRHRRLPRRPDHSQAWISDIVFARACSDGWTAQQRRCIDKVTAVDEARAAAPGLRFAHRHAVLDVPAGATLRDVQAMLAPYLGRPLVAKPAHSCGGVLFLEEAITAQQWSAFHVRATRDYYALSRERIYRGLRRRIVIEDRLGEAPRALADFKFFCSNGNVIGMTHIVGELSNLRRTLYALPERTPLRYSLPILDYIACGSPFLYLPDGTPPPTHWDDMIAIAARLSEPFDFVRIDLYDLPEGPYFGEFTFLWSGGRVPCSSMELSDRLVQAVRRSRRHA
jgi:TupA-like ATPgrasp